jgi:hypothetical protein
VNGHLGHGESVEIPGVGPYPLDAARDLLLGDAVLRLVVSLGTDVRNVVTDTRHIREAVRAAIAVRDQGRCVVPRCGLPVRLEIHHTASATGYADTGQTTLDQLAVLCHHHHDLTHHGATLTGDHQQGWHWTPPPTDPTERPPRNRHRTRRQRAQPR